MLSARARTAVSLDNPAFQNILAYNQDAYDKEHNPTGIVKLSTADNNLCKDIVKKKLSELSCQEFDGEDNFRYPVNGGSFELVLRRLAALTRRMIKAFVERYFKPEIEIKDVNCLPYSGVSSLFDALGCALCNPGDAILCPAPYYLRIYNDFMERSQAEIVSIQAVVEDNMKLTVGACQEAFARAEAKGVRVKAILLTNPCNPTGTVYHMADLLPVLKWAMSKDIFCIVNEIYALSVYDGSFESVLSYASELSDVNKLVWLWGMSKDFCTPGLRFGTVYCSNDELIHYLELLEFFQPCPPITHRVARHFLTDYEWFDRIFYQTNIDRLRVARDFCVKELSTIGIRVLPAKAGFFVMADLRSFLSQPTFEAERELNKKLIDAKLLLVCSEMMKSFEPGWFRIVFTGKRDDLIEGISRLEIVLRSNQK